MTAKILFLNGPNLNLLGTREPEKYGTETLQDVVSRAEQQCKFHNLNFEAFQTNHEGIMLDKIHSAKHDGTKYIIINAGAWTHTSVALVDALSGVDIPFVEVHISNTHKREEFRHHSYLSAKAVGVILGLGTYSYTAAIDFAANQLNKAK
ncbi:catabolic 3-dehydroquinase [Meira miltonrushii]|uniref:Catabolic 3-dehydroquinase n=1 Tax=Meira miltonrushii TaxID=1280837 RepID=A0A316V6N4_9BASI|nr:catabolic 3-dehydroquinase [Meira miltonrushii]PWN33190.1 catabolic 3-dehydroquinase [Meira miltonrushii]